MSKFILSPLLAASLLLPAQLAFAAPPAPAEPAPAEPEPEPAPAPEPALVGGPYGEAVEFDWDGSGRAERAPSTGPVVTIKVYNGLRPVYLQRANTQGDAGEACEAPCAAPIGDASGRFILAGPGRRSSKPFRLRGGESIQLNARGGDPRLRRIGVALFPIAGVLALGLAIVPTRVNMPFGAGVGLWATAGAIAAVGLGTGLVLIRFSRTQVQVVPG